MSSNNTENGGPEPTESQGMSAEQLEKLESLLNSLENLPFDALSKLSVEVREAILAGRKTVDAEREQLNAERERLNAEREQLSSDRAAHANDLVKYHSEILPQLKTVIAASLKASEREAGQNIFMAEMNNALVRLESASTASKSEQAKAHMEVIDRLDTMAEAHALSHTDQMLLNMSISNRMDEGFSAMAAQNNQLQVSVDRIGEMMNRLHDFITNVRDVVRTSQDVIFTFQGELADFKKSYKEFNSTLINAISSRLDELPSKLGLRVKEIKESYDQLTAATKGLIERANKFSIQQEDNVNTLSERVADLGNLYTTQVRRLNNGLEDQFALMQSTLVDGVEGLLKNLSSTFQKSEVHGLLSQIYKMTEGLNHSQAGLTALLRSIQDEKESMVEEIQEAKDAFKINAKDIHESMSSIMDDKRKLMLELDDAMRAVKTLMDFLGRTRDDVCKVADSVGKMASLSTSGAMATGEYMMQQFQGINAKQQVEVLEAIRSESENLRVDILNKFLGGNQEGV